MRPWELCVCPICGRYKATSTGKNQLYCSGVGDQRHPGVAEESAWRKVEIAIKQVEGEDGA